MPAEFFALLLGPLGRYRDGFDTSELSTRFSFLLRAFDSKHFSPPCPSNFFTLSLLSQQLSAIEPFLKSFRLTPITHQKHLEPPNRGFVAEGK